MELSRFHALIEAYGADPSRWPEGEREAARILAQSSHEAREALAQARRLDDLLDRLPVAVAPEAEARIRAGLANARAVKSVD